MTEWIAVITITLLAVISPGPDFAMVSRNALTLSRRAGLLTALGIGAGVLVHVAYTLMGIGLLIQQSPTAFNLLKLVGAAYLIWLGIKMLRTRKSDTPIAEGVVALSDMAALRTGFLTNALNPKTTIFIVSLFMQVVQLDTPIGTRIAYGLFISAAHVAWFACVSLFFGAPEIRRAIISNRHIVDWVFGAALIAFGIALAAANLGAQA